MNTNTVLIGLAAAVVAALVAVILDLQFDLWLARHDVRLLRQVPLAAPDRGTGGDGSGAALVAVGLLAAGVVAVAALRVL